VRDIQTRPAQQRSCSPGQVPPLWRSHSPPDPSLMRNLIQKLRRQSHPLAQLGGVFLERTRIVSEIQFTTHFIYFFVVQTKRFVGSSVNVILTRQACGQRSSRAAESKRRALENHISERICYMFLISKSRGDRDQGRCTSWVLPKRRLVTK